jgi:hypothetical protein
VRGRLEVAGWVWFAVRDVFVGGNAVYGADEPVEAIRNLRAEAEVATAKATW